ncbi:MAG: MFS transporter [Lentisphaeria bacterium]
MLRFVVFLVPILINVASGGIFFITAYRFAVEGNPNSKMLYATGTMACWALSYAVSALVVGRFVKPARAFKVLLSSSVALLFVSIGFIVFQNLYVQFFWIALYGIVFALYCIPFQIYMKGFEIKQTSGIVASCCKYLASWSIGLAVGAFLFSSLSLNWSYGFIAFFAFFIFISLLLIEKVRSSVSEDYSGDKQGEVCKEEKPKKELTEVLEKVEKMNALADSLKNKPDCVMAGWVLIGLGTFTISIVRTLEPVLAVKMGISQLHAGLILALVSIMQAVVALFMMKNKTWFYHFGAILFLGLCGVIGLVLYALKLNCFALYMASVVYGVFSGMFYLFATFHSLVHPEKSPKYIGVNEALVGVGCVVGAVFGGIVAQYISIGVVFYICAAVIVFAVLLASYIVRSKMTSAA